MSAGSYNFSPKFSFKEFLFTFFKNGSTVSRENTEVYALPEKVFKPLLTGH